MPTYCGEPPPNCRPLSCQICGANGRPYRDQNVALLCDLLRLGAPLFNLRKEISEFGFSLKKRKSVTFGVVG